MVQFANAKINIGLQVLSRRKDGYHNLETVFYPIPLYDIVEVVPAARLAFFPSGLAIPGNPADNLCLKAYHVLAEAFDLPPVGIYLHKTIPMGAGLGGGSSDATAVLKALNLLFSLQLDDVALESYAVRLGADCAFFVRNRPVFATGIGTDFKEIDLDLSGYKLLLLKPDIHISTAEAYSGVIPRAAGRGLESAIILPPATWKDRVSNDFEQAVFQKYPELERLKALLYDLGAEYAAMSGSGSTMYGLFKEGISLDEVAEVEKSYAGLYLKQMTL